MYTMKSNTNGLTLLVLFQYKGFESPFTIIYQIQSAVKDSSKECLRTIPEVSTVVVMIASGG